jgi:phage FluMu protein Com
VAIQNRCVACDFVIEASDAMRGREVVCPKCETLNVLRSASDVSLMTHDESVRLEQERRRFMERLSGPSSSTIPAAPPARSAPSPAPDDAARGLAALAGRRLKDVSVYVLGMAYLLLATSFVLAGLLVAGTALQPVWKAFAFLGVSLGGVIVFVVLKFTSDSVRALADVTDLLRSIDVRLERVEELQDSQRVMQAAAARDEAAAQQGVG